MEIDYHKYYFLEDYLFNEVRNNFLKNGFLTPEEFFCIIIWKANRAKTRIRTRLLSKNNNLERTIKELTGDIFKEQEDIKKLGILLKKWKFYLPMATAILTVLYPDNFTIYDKRVCGQISFKETNSRKKYYYDFLPRIKEITQRQDLSLRDADRYLWGKSFYEDLKKFIKN